MSEPAGEAQLAGLVVRVALGAVWTPALVLLLVWAGAELVGDVFYAYLSVAGAFTYGHPISVAWLVSYVALGTSALHPELLCLTDGDAEVSRRRPGWWLPLGAVLIPLVISLFDPSRVLDMVAIVGVLLVVSRLGVMSGELFEQRQRLADDLVEQRRDRQAIQQLNVELGEANRQLEDAARLKEDLLSMASHELRTPLTPILGFSELLQVRGGLAPDQQQMVQVMGSNAKRMLRLVNDALAVSRASAGAMVSHPQQVALDEALRSVLKEVEDVTGPVDLAVDGYRAVVDPQHLEQIVINLLTNASKYGTPPISVTARSAGEGRIALDVADHGDGIPPHFQQHMWGRFVQKDHGDRRTATGVGLGLSIVKLLAETNHGTVSYRDGSPTGAVFTIELPGNMPSGPPPDQRHLQHRCLGA